MFRRFWRIGMHSGAIAAVALCGLVSSAFGQTPVREQIEQRPPEPRSQVAPLPSPPTSAYPLELIGLAGPLPNQPYTITPSFSVYEEYNDNIFFNNTQRQSDFITTFSPGLSLIINLPTLQLTAGYTLSGQLYAKESDLSNWVDHQIFLIRARYQMTSQLVFTVYDRFGWDQSADVPGQQGFVVQREESWNNALNAALAWEVTPRTSLALNAGYRVLRFPGGVGTGSDSYTTNATLTYQLTRRLSGIVAGDFSYLKQEDIDPTQTYVPRFGLSYLFTPTLSGSVTAGPSITVFTNQTILDYVIGANITQILYMGGVTAQYNRGVDSAGGFTGTSNLQTVSVSGWFRPLRDLVVAAGASYSTATSLSSQEAQQTDVNSVNANVDVTYQLTQWITLFGGYNFFRQRTGSSSTVKADVDQNRVRVGVQLGYPYNP